MEQKTQLLSPEQVKKSQALLQHLRGQLGEILFGQQETIDLVVIALAAGGNVLLEGLPGLGKTELCKGIADLLGLPFRRIQFTPDLLPSDITGSFMLEEQEGRRTLVFRKGPLFSNVVLVDEINRASPKTQSALLEAMQEQRVTVLGETYVLPQPFFVLATQNPIELEGTYPLPEAQLDRFLMKINVRAVGEDVLTRILTERRRGTPPSLKSLASATDLKDLFESMRQVFLPEPVAKYIARIVTATQPSLCAEEVRPYIRYGASPRAAIGIGEAARARALLEGRPNVDFEDVKKMVGAILGHRIILHHTARMDGVTTADVVNMVVKNTPVLERDLPRGMS